MNFKRAKQEQFELIRENAVLSEKTAASNKESQFTLANSSKIEQGLSVLPLI